MRGSRVSRGIKDLDTVLVAARYALNDQRLTHVRAYERRGAVWSDTLFLDRAELLEQLKAGKRVATGLPRSLPGDFHILSQVRRQRGNGEEWIVAGDSMRLGDDLDLPRF